MEQRRGGDKTIYYKRTVVVKSIGKKNKAKTLIKVMKEIT